MKKYLCFAMCVLFLFSILSIPGNATTPMLNEESIIATNEPVSISNPFSSKALLDEAELLVSDMLMLFAETYSDFGLTQNDVAQLKVVGPYSIVNIDENEIKTIDYYFVNNNTVLGIVHIYIHNSQLHAEFGTDYAKKINEYLSENTPFCIVHSNTGVYIASDSKVDTIANMATLSNSTASNISRARIAENSDITRINEYYASGILNTNLVTVSTFSEDSQIQLESSLLGLTKDSRNATRSAPPTPPLVPQNNFWCHNAVTASIVAAREPELHDGLTALDVFLDLSQGQISVQYGRAKKTCDLIEHYLTSPDHYTSYTTTAVSLSQFKNNIDAGNYVAAISLQQDGGDYYHVTLLYDYFVGVSGTTVRMMDPYNAEIDPISYRYCSWSGTTFIFSMYGNSAYTYEMTENVFSWY